MVKRMPWVAGLLTVLMLVWAVPPAWAVSSPVIQGQVQGTELCSQAICGAAVFVGSFQGQVGHRRHASGQWSVSVTHAPLPAPNESAAITGGNWSLLAAGSRFSGPVAGGTLYNNGNNTYTVTATLVLMQGGSGSLTFSGLLDHRVFPPTIVGTIAQ